MWGEEVEKTMAKILFLHGMRMNQWPADKLCTRWYDALLRGLEKTSQGRAHPGLLPRRADVELVYWGDLFRRPGDRRLLESRPVKHGNVERLLHMYYDLLRGLVRAADTLSRWDPQGRPRGPMARAVNHIVHQSAIYMHNGPVPTGEAGNDAGAFFRIQAKLRDALKPDTRIVVSHSLGTVIAYEGLCLHKGHQVDTLITVGSPIGTPHLILEPLMERLRRLLNLPADAAPPWPDVRRWVNFYAPADVWSVPVKKLAPIFGPQIVDVEVKHGNPHRAVQTHRLTTYLEHAELLDELWRALEATTP